MICGKLNRPRAFVFAAIPIIGLLSGCNSEPTNLTDEQILGLLGVSTFPKALEGAPLSITKVTDDCFGMLSGLDSKILKDIPTDMATQMRTSCVSRLKAVVEDTNKNTYGLTMEMISTPDFAARVHAIKQEADKKVQAYTDAIYEVVTKTQVEREKGAKDKAINELISYRANYADFLSTLEGVYNSTLSLCDTWTDYALRIQRNPSLRGSFNFQRAPVCNASFDDLRMMGENNLSKIDMLKVEKNGINWYFDKPVTDDTPVSRGWFNAQSKQLSDGIAAMRKILGE